jgi:triacylglycerol lipase
MLLNKLPPLFNPSNLILCIMIVALSATIVIFLLGCGSNNYTIKKPSPERTLGQCVVLLHGLARTYHSMDKMQTALTRAGYLTVNLNYPSRKEKIEDLAAKYIPLALSQCRQFNPFAIHFVTHSLGGIVVRMAIKQNRPKRLGRVVMLSPPNRGSVVVDHLKKRWYYAWLNGPAGRQLATTQDSIPNQLGPVDFPVGIITGDRHAFFDKWLTSYFKGPNDGKVSVKRAKVDGMTDFLVVHATHPFIMNSEEVQSETIHFLKTGAFTHQP